MKNEKLDMQGCSKRKKLFILRLTLQFFFFLFTFLISPNANAQYNTDRLLMSGRVSLHYEDYVLSIQCFSQIILLKPYLYEPWQLRAIAKFYLDDYNGAEADATEAINLNPYIPEIYDLRALSRIRQKKYTDAITDYNDALRLSPGNLNYTYNRAVCYMEEKDYKNANIQIDSIINRWSNYAQAYNAKAELCIQEKDTTKCAEYLDKSLAIDPHNADAWRMRSAISLSRKLWKEADKQLSKYLHYRPKSVDGYINRALARVNINNLRGAMSDYDMALETDPNNFIAHYNRGLLRQQVGDDNRAIEDFDFVIRLEPHNIQAIYNRALLNDVTGNLKAAIRDYTTLINEFPNFWVGLQRRANCYKKLGMTAKAEMDEFRIFKAQMDKHLGVQPRWSRAKLRQVRKRSDINLDKYASLVVQDDEDTDDHEYQSAYRGKVQNKEVVIDFLPEKPITGFDSSNGQSRLQNFADAMAHDVKNKLPLPTVSLDSINAQLRVNPEDPSLLYTRGTIEAKQKNYAEAIDDLTKCLHYDSRMPEAYFNRGLCYMFTDKREEGLRDLGKAGELGLFSAYSVMKKFNKDKK